MTKIPSAQHTSRRLSTRNPNASDQTKQRRIQHPPPPKRSVSSLSATQLERKRANDREAQRLIRQRTKDRIDGLERQISDLRNENERLNRYLRQRSLRETEVLYERSNHEVGSTSWNCSKVTPLSCGDEVPSQSKSSSYRRASYPTILDDHTDRNRHSCNSSLCSTRISFTCIAFCRSCI